MIIEDVDVDSWENWQKVVAGNGMKEVVNTWSDYADESTLVTIYGNKIK